MPISEAPLRIAQPPPGSNGTCAMSQSTTGYAIGASTQSNGTSLPAKYGVKGHLNAMNYGDLVQLAEKQRRQLDTCQHGWWAIGLFLEFFRTLLWRNLMAAINVDNEWVRNYPKMFLFVLFTLIDSLCVEISATVIIPQSSNRIHNSVVYRVVLGVSRFNDSRCLQ